MKEAITQASVDRMEPLTPLYTAHLFAPLHQQLVELLEGLDPADWERPTMAPAWRVRDVAAHLVEVDLRRLSVGRDGHRLEPGRPIEGYRDLVTSAEQALAVELADAELVIPLAGLGGEMGSWGASLCARVAALKGATTLAVVNTPFSAEGSNRRTVAADALRLLRMHADGVLGIPNDPLLKVAPRLPIMRAFEVLSRLSIQPVLDLLRVLAREDLPVLKHVLREADDWQLGVGEGGRDNPEMSAIDAAFASPWIGLPPDRAEQVILLLAMPDADERTRKQILWEVDVRAPRASVLWGSFAEGEGPTRATVLLGF